MNKFKTVIAFGHELSFGIKRYRRYQLAFQVDARDAQVIFKEFDTDSEAMDSLIPSGLDLMFKYRVKHIDMFVIDQKTEVQTHRHMDFKTIVTTQLVVSSPVKNR